MEEICKRDGAWWPNTLRLQTKQNRYVNLSKVVDPTLCVSSLASSSSYYQGENLSPGPIFS
jgi:hypothetical protein